MSLSSVFQMSLRAAAPSLTGLLMISAAQAADMPARTIVESHDVLLLDVSGSMEQADLEAAFTGVAGYYLSSEAMMDYEAGICTANTVIYYGDRTMTRPTHILCSKKDVEAFIAENIDNMNVDVIRIQTGKNTNVSNALMAAANVFEDKDHQLNIEAGRHRVVLIGDENGGSANILSQNTLLLAAQYGATTHAFAIGSAEVADFFRAHVVTPPRIERRVEDARGRVYHRGVAMGQATYALSGQDVSTRLKDLLTLGGF